MDSCWIDGLQRQVRVRKKALPEIMIHLDHLSQETEIVGECHISIMITLFRRINFVIESMDERSNENETFYEHVINNLLYDDKDKDHLPIPVFSYITPTMTTSFLLHIMLSMGQFETEIDICMHPTLRQCFQYCKLIGKEDDESSLIDYTNILTRKYIEEQLQYFPNTKRVIDFWIVTAYNLFYRVIVDNQLPVTEMPPVQLSSLLASNEEEIINH